MWVLVSPNLTINQQGLFTWREMVDGVSFVSSPIIV